MAILKILNDGYHNNQVICPDILYDLLHSWPSIHTISCKYSHADKSYINFEFSVVAIFFFFYGGYYKIRWYVHTLGMIRYTVDHQYTHLYANIHMYNKVIKNLSFQWRPFWKFKMAVTAPARSRVFISYMIIIITNYQYTKFHVNIHMHNKVIEILSFQWRPFWKFKMAVTTAARSWVFFSYMILILKNY